MSDLAHEFGHAIEGHSILNRYNEFYKDKNRILSEVASMFYELEFLRYLQKNRINMKETTELVNNYHDFTKYFLEGLVESDVKETTIDDEKFMCDSEKFFINEEGDMVRPFKKVGEENGPNYWLSFYFKKPIKYGFGSYMALNLSELKKQDPKEFNKAWNHYLSMRTLMSYRDIFDLFGLDIKKFTSGEFVKPTIINDIESYQKQLKRQL